ncbi:MAG: DUF4159 domain-containing protein [Bacteroidales bacterium]|nr:DUF4159 domain-containing protein [Bacteroidales bacterium]
MKLKFKLLLIILCIFNLQFLSAQSSCSVKIALLKYNGGGDWYANPTSLPNLVKYCNENLKTNICEDIPTVEPSSNELFNYPFIHLTGHGNIIFSDAEAKNIRDYLTGGGFLHIDDNYGMDKFVRPQIKKIFPDIELIELGFDHPVFKQKYTFNNGLPKIHEHDGKPPQAFGIIYNTRLVLLYTYECDLGDGWEDPDVHKDSPATRLKALQMGTNIIQYSFKE